MPATTLLVLCICSIAAVVSTVATSARIRAAQESFLSEIGASARSVLAAQLDAIFDIARAIPPR